MSRKFLFAVCAMFLLGFTLRAQPTSPLPLWPEGAPGALGTNDQDIPTLTAFVPDPAKATGAAMVICPGGAYAQLAPHEGKNYALWLAEQGVTGFVLKYRLGTSGYRHPCMLLDAARAVRLVRAHAAEWKLDPHRIGIMGSSAGGHLAATLLTHFDVGNQDSPDVIERESSRPDMGILCYAVITMGDKTHKGSRKNLLGDNPSPEMIQELSDELHVTPQTPPCFIFATSADTTVPVENSLEFAAALRRAKVPFALHIYENGKHGMGLGSRDYDPAKFHPWTRDCSFWLKENGYVK
jgi:acetyl esterase/lipase